MYFGKIPLTKIGRGGGGGGGVPQNANIRLPEVILNFNVDLMPPIRFQLNRTNVLKGDIV